MTIQGAIFDLDGTLVDTLDDIIACTNAGLKHMGAPTVDRDTVRRSVGDGISTLCERVLPDPEPEIVRDMVKFMRAYYKDTLDEQAAPYAGVVAMLEGLAAKGIRLAVLSNKPDQMTQSIVGRMFKEIPFEAVLGQKEGVALKPDPAGALRIALEMGLEPDRFLYVGDTEVDLNTGWAANMHTLAVTWGFRTRQELIESGAKNLVNEPLEIMKWAGAF